MRLDGLELDRLDGAGPTLVFLHEGLGCASAWRDWPARVAAATGLGAVVWSRRGYGRSAPRARPWPLSFMHDEAVQLPALLDALRLDEVVLYGHSDGASIALLVDDPRVRARVLEAPHVFVEDKCVDAIARLRAAWPGELRARLVRRHDDPDGLFAGWTGAWLDPDFRRWDLRPALARVRAPLLVAQGEDDAYGTLAQVDAVCAGVSGPSERLVLPACGHAPHRDRPDELLPAVARFLTARS